MAIKHIGFSVIDRQGDLPVEYGEIIVMTSVLSAEALKKTYEHDTPEFAPYRLVRVLIDDEVENG